MQTVTRVNSNLWRRTQGGLFAPNRRNFPIDSLAFYAPLWHPELSDDTTIVSKDLNAHSCTVSGTVHSPNVGRVFDGDDGIVVPIDITSVNSFTAIAWFKTTGAGTILGSDNTVGGANAYLLRVNTNLMFAMEGATGLSITSTAEVNDGVWHIGAVIKDANTIARLFVDDAADGTDASISTVLAWSALSVGCLYASTTPTVAYTGDIGEVWFYTRVFSVAELAHIRNATIWRYP